MPFRQRLDRLKTRVTDRLHTLLPDRNGSQPSISLPVLTVPNAPPPASGDPAQVRPQYNVSLTNRNSATDPGAQALTTPPPLAQTTSDINVTSPSHKAEQAQAQLVSSQPVSPVPVLGAPSTAAQNANTSGWTGLKAFLRVIDQNVGVFGPLKAAIGELVGCIETYERAANGRGEFKVLQDELENLFGDLQQHLARDAPHTVTASMESLCNSILRELGYVKRKEPGGDTIRQFMTGEDSDEVLACYRRIQGYLQRLSLNSNLSMWKIVDEQATDARLDRLCPTLSACYNSAQATGLKRGTCTPGTRIEVLGQMHGWVHNRVAGSIYWLNGMAGTGKTTIAYTLCSELDATHELGASFFCSRSLPDCRDVNLIIPSIAYQLAAFSRPFRSALSQVLERERNVHTRLLRIQFEALIVKPLISVRETLPEDLVVVIDALDECDDQQSTGRILDALFAKTSDLPIKFFVSSRPEPEIRDQMKKQGKHRASSRLVLHELDKGVVQGDIETYLREALAPIHPTEPQLTTLVERAGILFIYAATVARYIGYDSFRRNPRARLKTILDISTPKGEGNPYKEIDELYTVILRAAIDDPELSGLERDDIKQILYTVVCAREPLAISALSGLLGLGDVERVHAALRPLWSVLHVLEISGLVATLHASFPDYIFDPDRSKAYSCNPTAQNHMLTRCCFDCIKDTMSQFNICGLESSHILDEKVENLSAKIDRAIPPELFYACRYWVAHLEFTEGSNDIVERLEDFMSTRLLLWMEVMNLKNCIHVGVEMIRQVEDWSVRQACPDELVYLTHDAWRFVAAFTSSPVQKSTPHIYVSMLPFWPESSPIAKKYSKRIQMPMMLQGPAIARRRLELLTTWSVGGYVGGLACSPDGTRISLAARGQLFLLDATTGRVVIGPLSQKSSQACSVGFSPDSTRIVAGYVDGTIRLWDVRSGDKVLGPLKGHISLVNSVSFSPDGTRLVSGSYDKSIRIWDVPTGKKISGALTGHSNSVAAVAFSHESARIVSGSWDNTLRLWDARTGQIVLAPLEGHTDRVTSVAFSPESTRIASGSYDNTVRVWDAQNGQTVFGPLEGHIGWVTSVSFSPNGDHIVSGSDDRTLRMWNARNGNMVLGPLKGHINQVTLAAFSPDGTRIISGSVDCTVRVWDARSRQVVPGSLEGHTDTVTSVAFSPDSTRIVSGSRDRTICVWDAQTGVKILGPLKGHAGSVTSAAFSPNGSRIVSGSDDKTIRVWDTRSGQKILAILEGHAWPINEAAFSPDGTRIISCSGDPTIGVWDAESGRTVFGPLEGHTQVVTSVAFSPDGTRIASGSCDCTIRVWDARNGKTILVLFNESLVWTCSIAFSPDSRRIVSGSTDHTICVWDAESGQKVLSPLKGHAGLVQSVGFSPDGSRIVSGSEDITIRVWDAKSGQTALGPLAEHTSSVTSVSFSPDGTRIVSGSADRTVRIWNASSELAMEQYSTLHCIPWGIDLDGWVTDSQSRLLLWVPPDIRSSLHGPRTIFLISADGHTILSFENAQVDEPWTEWHRFI